MVVNVHTSTHTHICGCGYCACLLGGSKGGGNLGVEHKHKGGSDGTEGVGSGSLEKSTDSLFLHDLLEAVNGSVVDPLILGLLGLHLQTTTDGVEGVRGVSGRDGGHLGADELGSGTEETVLTLLVRVVSRQSVKESEVDSTVGDDSGDGNSDSVVKSSDTRSPDGLDNAVNKTVELGLSATDIGGKTGTGVVERVDNHERSGSGETSGGHVDQEELSELGLLVGLGEHGLDGVLEGKVEGLGGEIPDDVGEVSTPEGTDSLLTGDTGEAVDDSGVPGDLSADNLGVGILCLDEELHTLNGGGGRLGNGTGHTTGKEVEEEIVGHDGRRSGYVVKKSETFATTETGKAGGKKEKKGTKCEQ